jgi:hypothetical protein
MCTAAHTLCVPLHQISRLDRFPTATGRRRSSGAGRNSHSVIALRQSETIYIVYLGRQYPLGVAHVDRECRLPDQEGLRS